MDNTYSNRSIHCTVDTCKFHNDKENYCSLESIRVQTHEKNPTKIECTDCGSFMCKDSCKNCM
ncbi:MAG: DUF1540 domain-containing protein [Eubacteriales bacterium]|nr:DUF1540 domain-containing protein [Eubacteriales bacterium]